MNYISKEQLARSLPSIKDVHPFFGISFLAFKKAEVPVGTTMSLNFSAVADDMLEAHYRPVSSFDGFYQPLKTGNKKGRWVSRRYGSTSLQRITKDTFGAALLHPSGSSDWGWQEDYLKFLESCVQTKKIPTFHLAAWLFRNVQLNYQTETGAEMLLHHFFREFNITTNERRTLFDEEIPKLAVPWLSSDKISEEELLKIVGFPPGYSPPQGVVLKTLELRETGPATFFRYEPSERLNIVTGDNGLGKTFILECVWWALTGRWSDTPILPRINANAPVLSYELSLGTYVLPRTDCHFVRQQQRWDRPDDNYVPGVVIYSRFDGSFAVLDPARIRPDQAAVSSRPVPLVFSRQQIWYGLQDNRDRKTRMLCNGLLQDWVLWQRAKEQYSKQYLALTSSLKILSPKQNEQLILGEPIRLPGDTSEIPTLEMPYGPVPVTQASAGVQRVITLAYILVWTWFEHVVNSEILGKPPQKRVVLIIDEVEAHLHPRWQRVLVPGIMDVVKELWAEVSAQIHIATHSPLILASAEPIFDEEIDDLHHLELNGQSVELSELTFIKRGTVDAWLMSNAFGLDLARNLLAEEAIKEALHLQLSNNPSLDEIRRVHRKLADLLASDDKFWPRWRSFATDRGVDE